MRRILGQIRGWSGPDRRSSAACLARSAACAVTKSPDGEVRLVPRAPAFLFQVFAKCLRELRRQQVLVVVLRPSIG
jgi:hypothetical protein